MNARSLTAGLLILALSSPAVLAREYTVRSRDTLWSIAARELGDGKRWAEIASANNLTEPFRIEVGQRLNLPDSAAAAPAIDAIPTAPADAMTPPVDVEAEHEAAPRPVDDAGIAVDSFTPSTPAIAIPRPPVVATDADVRHLTVDAAIALGLVRAPEIGAAAALVRKGAADRGVARAGALPQVTATGDLRRSETFRSITALGVDEVTAGGTLTVTQTLLSFGRLSSALKAATAQEAAALASFAAAKSRVRFRIETAFFDLLLARVRKDVATEAVAAAAALERRAVIRLEEGAGTRFDVSRARAERASREAQLAAASAAIDAAREELAVSMGLPPGTDISEEGDLFALTAPIAPEVAVRIGLAERPELAALEYSVRSGSALIDYERAQALPTIDATGSFTYTRHKYITTSPTFKGQDASSGFIGVGVTVPLFDGFRVRERVAAQTAGNEDLKARQTRAKLDAEKEIRAVYFDLDAAQKALAARRTAVAASRDALRMAEVSFEAGRVTSLDVIEASAALAEARGAEAEAAYSYRLGLARLVAAAGTDAVVEKGR